MAGKPVFGTPAFDGARAFFGTNERRVIAIDGSSGDVVWTVRADTLSGPPVVTSYSGCVIALAMVVCGDNGDLVAFDRNTGRFGWRFHPPVHGYADWQPIVAFDSTIYAAAAALDAGSTLYAVNAMSGTVRWRAVAPGISEDGAISTPAADTDIVVAPYEASVRAKPRTGGIFAVDARTGAARWNVTFPRIPPDSDTDGGFVTLWRDLVIASSRSGRIFGVNRATGAIEWNMPGIGRRPPTSIRLDTSTWTGDVRPIVIVGSRLYASSLSAWFIGYDLLAHQELWRVDPKMYEGFGLPIATDRDRVYVTYLDGYVGIHSARDGSVVSLAGHPPEHRMFTPIAIGPDRFFVGGVDGFYAFAK